MEIIDVGRDNCIKCHRELSISDKRSGMPICAKCITELINVIKGKIGNVDLDEYSDVVSNFTDFITSSSKLMKLDDIVVIQVCFNVYMSMVRMLGRRHPIVAKKIFEDAKRFIEIELERLGYESNGHIDNNSHDQIDDWNNNKEGREDLFGNLMNRLNDMKKDYNEENIKTDITDNEKGSDDDKVEKRDDDKVEKRDDDKGDNITSQKTSKKIGKKRNEGRKRINID